MEKVFRFILFLSFMAVCPALKAQEPNPFQAFDDIKQSIMSYDSYEALRILRLNRAAYCTTLPGTCYYNQALATAYALNGYKLDSIPQYEYIGVRGTLPEPAGDIAADTVDLSLYTPFPAKEYIVNRAKDEQILLMNESHTRPQSRLMLKEMLEGLYRAGYRCLCLEALGYQKEEYADLKNIMDGGFYTKEPCYMEFVRHALTLGYKIYGYETVGDDYKMGNNRDSIMAVHLRDIRAANGNCKMIVWAGHGHVFKSWDRGLYNYFKNLTGVTPLSVDQTLYTQRPYRQNEKPVYMAFFDKYPREREPVVLEGLQGKEADIYVLTPRLRYVRGRADYLLEGGWRKLKKITVETPSVVKVYYEDEYRKYGEKCTPVDILVAETDVPGDYYLAVPRKGKFTIIRKEFQ